MMILYIFLSPIIMPNKMDLSDWHGKQYQHKPRMIRSSKAKPISGLKSSIKDMKCKLYFLCLDLARRGNCSPSPGQRPGAVEDRRCYSFGPTDQLFEAGFGEPLARWADNGVTISTHPGRCPGLGERRTFGPENKSTLIEENRTSLA